MTYSTVVCASYNEFSICDCPLKKNPYEQYDQYRNYTCGEPSNISLDCSQCFINKKTISAKIQNQVYVPQSQRNSILNSSTIAFDNRAKPNHFNSSSIWGNNNYLRNQSDRNVPHRNKDNYINVPSRGSSTTTSITRNRPGSLAPGGTGVDVKHGSYQRYLAKKKANNIFSNRNDNINDDILIRQESLHGVALVNNNKQYRFNIIAVNNCCG